MEWQPIESAPRDGSAVLVYNDRGVHRCWWDEEWGTDGFWMIDVMKDDFPLRGTLPTHWLPLPAPPKAAPEQERMERLPSEFETAIYSNLEGLYEDSAPPKASEEQEPLVA